MKNLKMMLRFCGATVCLFLFGLLPMSFRTAAPSPAPDAIQSTKTCPTANFSVSGKVSGAPTYFSNLSTQFNTCSWDFGDGNSSTQTNPQHTYASPGTYQVRLTVFGDACTSSFIGTVDVIVG